PDKDFEDKPDTGNAASVNDDVTFEIVKNECGNDATGNDPLDKEEVAELLPYDPRLDLENYQFPTLDLLAEDSGQTTQIDMNEHNANKERIKQVLRSFGIEIGSIKASVGPTVTLYEITLVEGVRISRVRNLEDDIALSLSALGIRIIAPMPGKGTIGIEVPNAKPQVVSMRSILSSKKFQDTTFELPLALGKTITNDIFMVDLAKAPHMLVAGATGMGKSVGLNAIVTSLLYKKHPSELKFVIIDPKKVEFSIYAPIENHYLAKLPDVENAIITDVKEVERTLLSLCQEMDTRYDLLKQAGCRTIKEYNAKFVARRLNPERGHHFMPYIVVVIDEFGDLIMTAGKNIELPICRIAQLARAVGIHAIIATQRPTTNIITGTIKANFPARIAFRVSAMIDSRIILDRPGAQQLIGRGDMLYLQNADPIRVQCAFVDTPEVEQIASFIHRQQGYPEAFLLPEVYDENTEGGCLDVDMGHLDPMFEEAAQLVVGQQQGSTSLIQRKLSIGYNRAGRLMDQLEKSGVVGPAQGSKPREVLIVDLLELESLIQKLKQ
ncbi:MAG: DNA translocase FtsK, partial [Bacteroidales bacterium]|nr:DNA translocase FtsK [Bacteroidales bacterium]